MFINKIARNLSPGILRKLKEFRGVYLKGYSVDSYSQEGEDILLDRYTGSQESGFYIDVGAHHPVRFSNTCLFYRRGWRGINIEPNPVGISSFNKYRKRDLNIQMGVSDTPGELTYWMFNEAALNTFDKEYAEEQLLNSSCRLIETRTVPVMRLDAILDRYMDASTVIDFMTVDTEGFDFAVLSSNNWKCYRPRFLLVEYIRSVFFEGLETDQHKYLVSKGYRLCAKTMNSYLYIDIEQHEV